MSRERWAAAALLAALAVAAPLPFGGVVAAGTLGIRLAAFAALAVAAMVPVGRGEPLLGAARVPAAALAGIAALGLAQSLPWPAAVTAWLSPRHAELARGAGEILGRPLPAALSLAPVASRSAALGWLAAACLVAAAALAGRRRTARRVIAGGVVAGAVLQVLYGVPRWAAEATTVWGVEVAGDPHRLRGTFVNPNHLATFLLPALAVAGAAAWWAIGRARRGVPLDRVLQMAGPALLVWVGLFVALAFTGSRAALAAAVAATAAQGLLAAVASGRWKRAAVGLAAAAAGLAAVALVGLEQGLGRLLGTHAYDVAWTARRAVYGATFDLWLRFPVAGTGLGTFDEAFPMVQPPGVGGGWEHAHNDVLELAATGGLVAVVLAGLGLFVALRALAARLAGAERSEDRAAALAALGALAGVGVQELFDFGLVLPANAALLAIVVGAALGVGAPGANTPRAVDPRSTHPPE